MEVVVYKKAKAWIAEKFSPEIRGFIIYVLLVLGLIYQFLFKNVYGMLLSALIIYWISFQFFHVNPLSLPELVLWIDGLDLPLKGLIFSSFLTIIGFLVAFSVAISSWKRQMKINIRLDGAKEIDQTYNKICRLILIIKAFSKSLIDTYSDIQSGKDINSIHGKLLFIDANKKDFEEKRNEMTILLGDAHAIFGRYANVFFATPGTTNKLLKINNSIQNINVKMWSVPIPFTDINDPNAITKFSLFVNNQNIEELKEVVRLCEEAHPYISAISGELKGRLTRELVELNFSYAFNIIKHGVWMIPLLFKIQEKEKISDEKQEQLIARLRGE